MVGQSRRQRNSRADHTSSILSDERIFDSGKLQWIDRDILGELRVPGFPGMAKSAVTRGESASFQASACSRPPLAVSNTFMTF